MNTTHSSPTAPAWSAVFSLAIGVAGLIIAEFLPTGMLTLIARDLGISEGLAGQAVTATSVCAIAASLLTAYVTRHLDRRVVLLWLSGLLVVSNLMVAFAPSFLILMVGRLVLGVSLGGFWSMATATAMRLVPPNAVPRALAIVFGGSSLASVFAAPLSSFLGNLIGWRQVFLLSAGVSGLALVIQFFTIPPLAPRSKPRLRTLIDVLRVPEFGFGMFAVGSMFCGHFAAFTYVRPFLERTTRLDPDALSAVLLAFGLGNFVGTSFAGRLIERGLRRLQISFALVLAAVGVGFVIFGASAWITTVLLFTWGATVGPLAVGWSAWVSRKVPDHTETAGGISVASIQFAAGFGAMAGGAAFEWYGPAGVHAFSVLAWMCSAAVVLRWISTLIVQKSETSISH